MKSVHSLNDNENDIFPESSEELGHLKKLEGLGNTLSPKSSVFLGVNMCE